MKKNDDKNMKEKEDKNMSVVAHVRLSPTAMAMVDCCAKVEGLRRSAFLRKIVCERVYDEMSDSTIRQTEKIIRKTLEQIIDIKSKYISQIIRELLIEVQRANIMHLKDYIEHHPGLDISEYRTYYYQSEKEAYEILSGRKSFDTIFSRFSETAVSDVPEWLKFLTGDEDI